MTLEERVADLETRLQDAQRAIERRKTRADIYTLADEVEAQIEALTRAVSSLTDAAVQTKQRTAELSARLEEAING
jgi:uncharacterized coiled-coil DUF342 family protein